MYKKAELMHVEPGKTLLVTGPASLERVDGEASILGAPLDSSRIIVTRGKQIPIEIHSFSSFGIHLGEESSVEAVAGSTIPHSWHEAASTLIELEEGTAVVIGGVDAGKSSLCTFLANFLVREGKRAAMVDADIGQTDMGPPTTMAAADMTNPVTSLSLIEPSERLFLGYTSPGHIKGKVIRGVRKLANCHTKPGTLVVVNTDGWVTGDEATAYKVQMLDELKPSLVLGIGSSTEISEILQTGNRAALLAGSPDTIKERTRVDRRELRALGYQKYLAGSSVKTLRLDGVKLLESASGDDLDMRRLRWSQAEELKDSIVGLLDQNDFLQEIGVLREIMPSTRTVKIFCRGGSVPRKIEVGAVKLNKEFREIGSVEG